MNLYKTKKEKKRDISIAFINLQWFQAMVSKKKKLVHISTRMFSLGAGGEENLILKLNWKKNPNHIIAFNIIGMYFMVDKILIMINRYLYLIKVSYICLRIILSMKIQTNEAFSLIG